MLQKSSHPEQFPEILWEHRCKINSSTLSIHQEMRRPSILFKTLEWPRTQLFLWKLVQCRNRQSWNRSEHKAECNINKDFRKGKLLLAAGFDSSFSVPTFQVLDRPPLVFIQNWHLIGRKWLLGDHLALTKTVKRATSIMTYIVCIQLYRRAPEPSLDCDF